MDLYGVAKEAHSLFLDRARKIQDKANTDFRESDIHVKVLKKKKVKKKSEMHQQQLKHFSVY